MKLAKKIPPEIYLFALALLIRLFRLSAQSIDIDEAYSVWMATRPLHELFSVLHYDAHPPLFYLLLRLWAMGGMREFYLRLPSALLGACSAALVYRIGKNILEKNAAAIAAIFWACSFFVLYEETITRMYAYALAFSLLATLFFWKSVKEDRLGDWLLYFLFAFLALYTHYYSGAVLLAHILFLAYEKKWGKLVTVTCVLAAGFLPWAHMFAEQYKLGAGIPRTPPGYLLGEHSTGRLCAIAGTSLVTDFFSGPGLTIAVGAMALLTALWGCFLAFRDKGKSNGAFLALVFGVPFFIPWIVSCLTSRDIIEPRFIYLCAPYYFLLFFYACYRARKILAYSLLGAAILMNLGLRYLFVSGPAFQMDNWREAAAVLSANVKAGDTIAVESGFGAFSLWYYLPRLIEVDWNGSAYYLSPAPGAENKVYFVDGEASIPFLSRMSASLGRTWVVLFQNYFFGPSVAVERWFGAHARLLQFYSFRSYFPDNIIRVYLFQVPRKSSR